MRRKRKGSVVYEVFDWQNGSFFDLNFDSSSKNQSFYSNCHPELEIIYVVTGPEQVTINNVTYIAKPGDLVVVNSGQLHTGTGGNWSHYALILPNNYLEHLNLNLLAFFFTPQIRDERLAALFLKVVKKAESTEPYHEELARVAIEQFLLALLQKYGANRTKALAKSLNESEAKVASQVLDYLHGHFSEDFSIEEIARYIGVSPSYMCQCVKDVTGSSIIDRLNTIRCRAAYHYMMNTDKKIGEIAALCGFHGRSYFAKIFRKELGVLPSEIARMPALEGKQSPKAAQSEKKS